MRNSKAQTVRENIEDFLNGRSEDYREKFLAKDLQKQYLSIVNWKRRQDAKAGALATTASNLILKHVRAARKALETGAELSDAEMNRIDRELKSMKASLADYSTLRARRELESLQRENERIAARIDAIKSTHNL